MKFSGEIKFPEIDHPGVPVQFVIEGRQAELVVEGESLGRWSLYDVHARRLVASAFQIDLAGTEVTFVADDPIDFAYRGVEHMAETWATMKSKQVGRRMVAVRSSRKGTIPSRIDELRNAMEANLEVQSRPLAGEPVMPTAGPSTEAVIDQEDVDWDARDAEAAIPLIGEPETSVPDEAEEPAAVAELGARLAEEMRRLEEEKERIAEERARLDAERQEAEQRETVRIEAYRMEMERLEAEREELRSQAAEAAERAEALAETTALEDEPTEEPTEEPTDEPTEEPTEELAETTALDEEPTEELAETTPLDDEPTEEPTEELAETTALDEEPTEELAETTALDEEPTEEPTETTPLDEEPEELAASEVPVDAEPEEEDLAPVAALDESSPLPEAEVTEADDEPEAQVVDLSGLEEDDGGAEPDETPLAPAPQPQPALTGAAPTRERGLRGAVRAAFARGSKEHEHQFIEAPGGIGIIRYVCEICGYVSISVDDD